MLLRLGNREANCLESHWKLEKKVCMCVTALWCRAAIATTPDTNVFSAPLRHTVHSTEKIAVELAPEALEPWVVRKRRPPLPAAIEGKTSPVILFSALMASFFPVMLFNFSVR